MIKNKIRELRNEKGMTQKSLAEAVGVTTVTISRIENGQTWPNIYCALAICRALGKYLDEVFFLEGGK